MADVHYTNVRVFDGGGEAPFMGEVLVQGDRIARVVRSGQGVRAAPVGGAQVIDGAGAFLMPGMVEAHTHFSWNDQPTLDAIQRMPPEEHILWCAQVAERYHDMGGTSCVGAATAKPRLDVVIRNAINSGQIPGPRYLAASQEITVPGALGDETLPHLPFPEFSFGVNVNSADEMRKAVRMFLKYGVDSIKLNLSGDNFTPDSPAETNWMSDAEVAAAMDEVRVRGKRGTAHARSAASVKQALRHGIDVIYHASYSDTESLDMLEAAKDRVFVAPGIAILYAMLHEAEPWGISIPVENASAQPDSAGPLASRRQEDFRRRGMAILFEEVMLRHPHAVDAGFVRRLDQLEMLLEHRPFRVFLPRSRSRQFEEH